MNTLREALQEYLTLRRGLGFKMHDAGLLLPEFVAFMEERQVEHITHARTGVGTTGDDGAARASGPGGLCFVRGFARHRSATDRLTEIPPVGLLPHRSTRARPYLYAERRSPALAGCGAGTADGLAIDAVATLGLSLPSRLAQCHGPALSEALDLKLERCRSRTGRADDPQCQVRPVPTRTSAFVHLYRTGRLPCSAANSSSAAPVSSFRVRLQPRHSARHWPVHRTFYALSRQTGLRATGASKARGCMTSGIALPFRF